MAKFHVTKSFEVTITGRELFALVGEVDEGEIHAGMFVHVPCNTSLSISARIDSIEFARTPTYDAVCLLLELQSDEWELFRGLNIANETIEVTDNDSL